MFSFEFCNLLNIISRALRFMLRILILRVSVDLCRSSSDNAEPSGETVRRMDLNSAIILSTFAHEFLFLTSPGSRINPAFSKDLFRLLIIAEMPGAVSTRIIVDPITVLNGKIDDIIAFSQSLCFSDSNIFVMVNDESYPWIP